MYSANRTHKDTASVCVNKTTAGAWALVSKTEGRMFPLLLFFKLLTRRCPAMFLFNSVTTPYSEPWPFVCQQSFTGPLASLQNRVK